MNCSKDRKIGRSLAKLAVAAVLGLAATAGLSRADEVILNDGNKLTGTIGLISGDLMKFTSATLRLKNGTFVSGTIKQADATQIVTTDGKTIASADVVRINPPPVGWTGSVVANGVLARGNSNSESFGLAAGATLRRDTPQNDDRLTLNGSYNFVRSGRGATGTDTTDNAGAGLAYDLFFTQQLYGYADAGVFHDRIADLNYRLTPGVGAGYQWVESKAFNFSTEGGVSYLYQDYQNAPIQQDTALRLAYHADYTLNDTVSLFNNVEYLVPFKFGETNRYVLTADAGVRANLTKSFFSEFKVVYHRNDRPPTGFLKDDLMYLLGVGWQF
jgi:putative salt-induced outer membrane protein YdiY